MKLDILVLAAHPDDAELCCSGTLLAHIAQGKKAGIVDYTQGEMGTRGTLEIRAREAAASAEILGLSVRENLKFRDAFFQNDEEHQLATARIIRKYQPEIIITNAIQDRHPDHAKGAQLSLSANFLAGLRKIETDLDGKKQAPWRAKRVYNFIQSQYIKPDFIVDVSEHWERKMESIRAFKSQFFDPESKEPETYISSPEFMKLVEARGAEFGKAIGVKYGEGYTVNQHMGVSSMFDMIS